jgi:hypothetical protein
MPRRPDPAAPRHDPRRVQYRLATLLMAVACVAVNLWLFRVGALWGILGLNITKHVVIAALCQQIGVDKRPVAGSITPPAQSTEAVPATSLPVAQSA